VKVEIVGTAATQAMQTFVGTMRAHRRAELSFEAPGRLADVRVDVGDHVRAGQVLASLDAAPTRWRLEKALADRDAAAAQLQERTTQLRLQEPLAKERIISAPALEAIRAQHAAAAAQLQSAEVAVAAARRDESLARIAAPFDGEIVARLVQPHADVNAAQAILQIEAPGALEVVVMLPDGIAAGLAPGQAARALVSNADSAGSTVSLALDRLSARSENGSLVPAIFRVEGASRAARSGSVVQVELPRAGVAETITVPTPALLPGEAPGAASVFVLDEQHARVTKRAVRVGNHVMTGGRLPVLEGLAPGDRVVIAGAAFLSDGQPAVRSATETQLLDAAR
jgi:RND family efflux transporter MFP subunit